MRNGFVVPGYKNKGYPAGNQGIGYRKGELSVQVNVQHGHVDLVLALDPLKSGLNGRLGTKYNGIQILKRTLDASGKNELVFDD